MWWNDVLHMLCTYVISPEVRFFDLCTTVVLDVVGNTGKLQYLTIYLQEFDSFQDTMYYMKKMSFTIEQDFHSAKSLNLNVLTWLLTCLDLFVIIYYLFSKYLS